MTFFDSYTLHGSQITIEDHSIVRSTSTPTPSATAGYRLNANGIPYELGTTGSYQSLGYNWVTPTTDAANYEVRATLVSGDTPVGTLNTWLALTSSRTWSLGVTDGIVLCTLTIEIRDAATQTIRDTATIQIEAEHTQF